MKAFHFNSVTLKSYTIRYKLDIFLVLLCRPFFLLNKFHMAHQLFLITSSLLILLCLSAALKSGRRSVRVRERGWASLCRMMESSGKLYQMVPSLGRCKVHTFVVAMVIPLPLLPILLKIMIILQIPLTIQKIRYISFIDIKSVWCLTILSLLAPSGCSRFLALCKLATLNCP